MPLTRQVLGQWLEKHRVTVSPEAIGELLGLASGEPEIRRVPPGVSGEDLRREDAERLRIGSVWKRGSQRVRIRAITSRTITVSELNHGSSLKREIPRQHFLRTSRPEA